MKRSLAIVLISLLLCALSAWLLAHRSGPEPALSGPTGLERDLPQPSVARLPQQESEARATATPARAKLAELEIVQLAFEGPQATLELHIVDAIRMHPVPEVTITLSTGRKRISAGEAGDELLDWEALTVPGNPPIADAGGRIAFRVPTGLALGVEISGTWVKTEQHRHELAALAPDEKRTEVIKVATEDDLQLFGEVIDGSTNAPLEGVEIQLERRPAIEPIATSDARGRFDLRTNSWESRKARAGKRGFAPVAFEIDDQHDSRSRALRLELSRAATVQGFYRDWDDKPLAEGSLRFWTISGFAAHVYPAENGWFEADSLPTGEAVNVDLELEHRPIERQVASVELAPGELRRIDWKLPPRYPVHGIVLDELGAPVKGCELALYLGNLTDLRCLRANNALDERESCTSDDQGRFTFSKASQGSCVIALLHLAGRKPFLGATTSWQLVLAAQNITVSGPSPEELVLRCWTHTTIQGRVLDSDDHPVPREELHVALVECGTSVRCLTRADGSFSVPVPGPYSFEVSLKGNGWFLDSEGVTARGGERDVVLRVKRAPVLRVRVVDTQTGELVRAQVFGIGATGATLNIWGLQADKKSGQLESPCPVDTYRLFARTFDDRCGTLDGAVVDSDSPTHEWTIPVAPGKHVRVHSSNAGGEVEVDFTWNGIPIEHGYVIERGSNVLLVVPPGTLSAKYRRGETEGVWQTLEAIIDDSRQVDIDLRFR